MDWPDAFLDLKCIQHSRAQVLSAPLPHDSGAALWDESLPLLAAPSGMNAIDMREGIQHVAVSMLTSLATLSIGRLRQRCCLGGVML